MDEKSSFRLAEVLGDGVRPLDQDHDDLMSLAQQMVRLHVSEDLPGSIAALTELLCQAEVHWRREVEMLRRYGYPDTEEHARSHEEAERKLAGLLKEFEGNAGYMAEDAIVRMMIDDSRWKWWFIDRGLSPQA